jgi:hypothetical protein
MTACARWPRARISANEPFLGGIRVASGLVAGGAGREAADGLGAEELFGGADDGRLGTDKGLTALPADPA